MRVKYRLRSVLLAAFLLALVAGFVRYSASSARKQLEEELAALEVLNSNECLKDTEVHWRQTAAYLIYGKDLFQRVIYLDCSNGFWGQSAPGAIQHFKCLKTLNVEFNDLRRSDIESISRCQSLYALGLRSCELTDVSIKSLSSLQDLEELDLGDNSLSSHGLRGIQALVSRTLRMLLVDGNPIDDEGAEVIANANNLKVVDVSYTSMTIVGVTRICRSLPGLQRITINGLSISEEEIEMLRTQYPALEIQSEF